MLRSGLIIFALLFASNIFGQDVDIYNKHKNDNFNFPRIPAGMTFDEFELLSTRLRMQDMIGAMVVPGFVHFKIKEKKYGWWLVGIRAAGYGGLAYLSYRNKSLMNLLINPLAKYTDRHYKSDIIVAYTSLFLIGGSLFYDWFHGRWKLHHKQNKIRYKYAPLMQLSYAPLPSGQRQVYIQAGIRINF